MLADNETFAEFAAEHDAVNPDKTAYFMKSIAVGIVNHKCPDNTIDSRDQPVPLDVVCDGILYDAGSIEHWPANLQKPALLLAQLAFSTVDNLDNSLKV